MPHRKLTGHIGRLLNTAWLYHDFAEQAIAKGNCDEAKVMREKSRVAIDRLFSRYGDTRNRERWNHHLRTWISAGLALDKKVKSKCEKDGLKGVCSCGR